MNKEKSDYSILRFNLIFWPVYFMYQWLALGGAKDQYLMYFKRACLTVPVGMVVSFISVHVLFRFYRTNKILFWSGQILLAITFVGLLRSVNYYVAYPIYYPEGLEKPLLFLPKLFVEFVNLYLIVSLYGLFVFMRSWYRQQQELQEANQEKISAELQLLKSQVQPHFIFNMLNNIYSGAVGKSPETADQILKLSSFIEYNLYDSKKELVELEDEISFIKDYLELQRVRVGDKLDISINVFSSITGKKIPPMLLLPLIENCFKHGIHKSLGVSWIRLDISTKNNCLIIKIENSLEPGVEKENSEPSGIGLANVRRRLELIYANRHQFEIHETETAYMVYLKICEE
jgi:sensor histidine kinase YesM